MPRFSAAFCLAVLAPACEPGAYVSDDTSGDVLAISEAFLDDLRLIEPGDEAALVEATERATIGFSALDGGAPDASMAPSTLQVDLGIEVDEAGLDPAGSNPCDAAAFEMSHAVAVQWMAHEVATRAHVRRPTAESVALANLATEVYIDSMDAEDLTMLVLDGATHYRSRALRQLGDTIARSQLLETDAAWVSVAHGAPHAAELVALSFEGRSALIDADTFLLDCLD